MAYTLTFHSLGEKLPGHGTEILFADVRYGAQASSNELTFGSVFYTWVDEEGQSWPYEPGDSIENQDGAILTFNIEYNDAGWNYGPVSHLKEPFAKSIYWTDYKEFMEMGATT